MSHRILDAVRCFIAAMLPLSGALLIGFSSPAEAQSFENLDRLDSLVAMSVGANRGEPGGPVAPIDRRLHLAACPQQPLVEAPVMNAAVVSCPAIGWRIRVPLAMAPKPQNTAITTTKTVQPPVVLIKKGDPVQLVAGNDEFSVSRMMYADEDGATGSLIRVREDNRSAPVVARVEAAGTVRIPGI